MADQAKRILLLEPEPLLAEITSFRLELCGLTVETVESATAAIDAIKNHPPDLLLTNLNLPGTDVPSFIERLSSKEDTCDLPILVLSVDADLDKVQAVCNLGANDFLVVPFHPEVLEEKVATLLQEYSEKTGTATAS